MTDEKKVEELPKDSDNATTSTKTPIEIRDALKKSVTISQDTTDMAQRTSAIQWASKKMADTNMVTQSTVRKSSARQKSVKIPVVKVATTMAEDKESLEAQQFIAGQYPPVEESVSSTVRLGKALVSGALGRRTDDPKIFSAAVNMTECSVRIQTMKKKAKVPVSAAPSNSIDSEADIEGMGDILLSLSATDRGTHIDLPRGGTETELQGINTAKDPTILKGGAADNSASLEMVTAPAFSYAADETIVIGRSVIQDPKIPVKQCSSIKPVTRRSVILADVV